MHILFITTAHNSLSQRLGVELVDCQAIFDLDSSKRMRLF
jgi:hypothetical protein